MESINFKDKTLKSIMKNKVSIIIPIYKEGLSDFEKVSLRQCFSILDKYKIKFICPKHMQFGFFHDFYNDKADFVFLKDENFDSIASYNYMLLSVWFYNLFIDYEYILIYQLDSFVFGDDLIFWIDAGYSYVGAPWIKVNKNNVYPIEFDGVGNGGFSLRNVKDCIKILRSNRKVKSLKDCIFKGNDKFYLKAFFLGLIRYHRKHKFNSIKNDLSINEDKVFSLAGKRFKSFKIPSPQVASSFSFEVNPNLLFIKNNSQLPFGCHAWYKYDLKFYIPIINKYGYNLKEN
jgi:hypothetical protein